MRLVITSPLELTEDVLNAGYTWRETTANGAVTVFVHPIGHTLAVGRDGHWRHNSAGGTVTEKGGQ